MCWTRSKALAVEELVFLLDPERVRIAAAECVVEDAAAVDGALARDRRRKRLLRVGHAEASTASTSISTFHAGSSRAVTTVAFAGRISRNTSPCARETPSKCAGSVTYNARPHDVVEARARPLERLADDLETQARLLVCVLGRRRAVDRNRRRAGDVHVSAGDDRAREAHDRLEGRVSGDQAPHHRVTSIAPRAGTPPDRRLAGAVRRGRRGGGGRRRRDPRGRGGGRPPRVGLEASRRARVPRRCRGRCRRSRRAGRPSRLDRAPSPRARIRASLRGGGTDRPALARAASTRTRASACSVPTSPSARRCRSPTTSVQRSASPRPRTRPER